MKYHLRFWFPFVVVFTGLGFASYHLWLILPLYPMWKIILGVFLMASIWFLIIYCFWELWQVYQFYLNSTPIDKDDIID